MKLYYLKNVLDKAKQEAMVNAHYCRGRIYVDSRECLKGEQKGRKNETNAIKK